MRPDVRRDPEALDRAARALELLAADLPTGRDDDHRARLHRVAEELASLAAGARRAAATSRAADAATAAEFRGVDQHVPAPGGAAPC